MFLWNVWGRVWHLLRLLYCYFELEFQIDGRTHMYSCAAIAQCICRLCYLVNSFFKSSSFSLAALRTLNAILFRFGFCCFSHFIFSLNEQDFWIWRQINKWSEQSTIERRKLKRKKSKKKIMYSSIDRFWSGFGDLYRGVRLKNCFGGLRQTKQVIAVSFRQLVTFFYLLECGRHFSYFFVASSSSSSEWIKIDCVPFRCKMQERNYRWNLTYWTLIAVNR